MFIRLCLFAEELIRSAVVAAHFGNIVVFCKRNQKFRFAQNGIFSVIGQTAAICQFKNFSYRFGKFFVLADEKQNKSERNHTLRVAQFYVTGSFV